MSPGAAAVGGSGPADGGGAAGGDASGLKRSYLRGAVGEHMRLNFGGMLAGSDGEWVGTDLGKRYREESPGRGSRLRAEAARARAAKIDRMRFIGIYPSMKMMHRVRFRNGRTFAGSTMRVVARRS
jgi:hypothetical protein